MIADSPRLRDSIDEFGTYLLLALAGCFMSGRSKLFGRLVAWLRAR